MSEIEKVRDVEVKTLRVKLEETLSENEHLRGLIHSLQSKDRATPPAFSEFDKKGSCL
jgi:hypothetical protein